jgi:hypothetical protein
VKKTIFRVSLLALMILVNGTVLCSEASGKQEFWQHFIDNDTYVRAKLSFWARLRNIHRLSAYESELVKDFITGTAQRATPRQEFDDLYKTHCSNTKQRNSPDGKRVMELSNLLTTDGIKELCSVKALVFSRQVLTAVLLSAAGAAAFWKDDILARIESFQRK